MILETDFTIKVKIDINNTDYFKCGDHCEYLIVDHNFYCDLPFKLKRLPDIKLEGRNRCEFCLILFKEK